MDFFSVDSLGLDIKTLLHRIGKAQARYVVENVNPSVYL
jgi:hypothetical protein